MSRRRDEAANPGRKAAPKYNQGREPRITRPVYYRNSDAPSVKARCEVCGDPAAGALCDRCGVWDTYGKSIERFIYCTRVLKAMDAL